MPLFLYHDGLMTVLCSIMNGVPSSPSAISSIRLVGVLINIFINKTQGIINMPIQFVPQPGTVLMCDFSGSIAPEMNKVRHVIVVSPRRRHRAGCCIVVPVSTVAPNPVERYHFRIPANTYGFFKADTDVWVKGDMVAHVSFNRLDRVLCDGKYQSPSITLEHLRCIQRTIWEALGKPELDESSKETPSQADKKNVAKESLLFSYSTVV